MKMIMLNQIDGKTIVLACDSIESVMWQEADETTYIRTKSGSVVAVTELASLILEALAVKPIIPETAE